MLSDNLHQCQCCHFKYQYHQYQCKYHQYQCKYHQYQCKYGRYQCQTVISGVNTVTTSIVSTSIVSCQLSSQIVYCQLSLSTCHIVRLSNVESQISSQVRSVDLVELIRSL